MKRTIICIISGLLLCSFLGAQEKTHILSSSLKDKIFQSTKSIDLWVNEMSLVNDKRESYLSSRDSGTAKEYECFTLNYDLSGNSDLILEGKSHNFKIKNPFIDIIYADEYGMESSKEDAVSVAYMFYDREDPLYSISFEGTYEEDIDYTTWEIYVDKDTVTVARYNINDVCFYDALDKLIAKYDPWDDPTMFKGHTFQRMVENIANSHTDNRFSYTSNQRQRVLSSSCKQLRMRIATTYKNGKDIQRPNIQKDKATLTFGYSSNCDLLFKAEDLNVSLSHPMKAGKFDKKEATDGYNGQEYLFLYDGIGFLSIIIIEEKNEVYPQIGWYNNDDELVNAYGVDAIDFYDSDNKAIVVDYISEEDGTTQSTNLFWAFVEKMYNLYK